MFGLFGCTPSVLPEESSDNLSNEERPETSPATTAEETTATIPEQTAEETTVPDDKKDGSVLAFSSSTAPASLPNNNSKIVGEFIADFEDPDNYFQGEERGGKLVCALNSDKTPKLFGNQYCSKALIEVGSSGTQGLNLYAKPGQNLSMRSHFHIKKRPDMRNYSGIMLYVDTTRVQWPNTAYISDPNDTKKHTAVSINIILSKSADNSLTSENYLDDVQSFFSYYNKTVRTIEAYYYDAASAQWMKTSNALKIS
mgnify:FL=1